MKKKYQIVRNVTYASGTQTFEVKAENREQAEQLFRDAKSEIVETDVEVEELENLDEFDFSEMYEVCKQSV